VIEWRYKDRVLKIVEGNIALLDADAVVNAANNQLILGGGVAGAIRHCGGPAIQEECRRLAPVETGRAVITGGGNLKARFVIHAVGPVYGEYGGDAKLAGATRSSLEIARDKKLETVALPAISTGIFGFPVQRASEIMLRTAVDFLRENEFPREIIFCLYGRESAAVFEKTLEELSREEGRRPANASAGARRTTPRK
jgi:O-acetyl-ADP-ribose deacetylase (regulator of RNase III)